MRLSYIRQECLDRLKRMPEEQRPNCYRRSAPWLDEFFGNNTWYAQSNIAISGSIELITEGDPPTTDLENSVKIYNALKNKLTEVQAADPRLWVYFCHEMFWSYMIWRWPPDSSSIESRYFVDGSSSRALSRNGIARLWWFAHLTYDEGRDNPYELTKVFLQNQDIQHNLIERNFGRSRTVLHATLDFLRLHSDVNGKEDYVKLGKAVNRLGGVCLLDCLGKEEILAYLENKFSTTSSSSGVTS